VFGTTTHFAKKCLLKIAITLRQVFVSMEMKMTLLDYAQHYKLVISATNWLIAKVLNFAHLLYLVVPCLAKLSERCNRCWWFGLDEISWVRFLELVQSWKNSSYPVPQAIFQGLRLILLESLKHNGKVEKVTRKTCIKDKLLLELIKRTVDYLRNKIHIAERNAKIGSLQPMYCH